MSVRIDIDKILFGFSSARERGYRALNEICLIFYTAETSSLRREIPDCVSGSLVSYWIEEHCVNPFVLSDIIIISHSHPPIYSFTPTVIFLIHHICAHEYLHSHTFHCTWPFTHIHSYSYTTLAPPYQQTGPGGVFEQEGEGIAEERGFVNFRLSFATILEKEEGKGKERKEEKKAGCPDARGHQSPLLLTKGIRAQVSRERLEALHCSYILLQEPKKDK